MTINYKSTWAYFIPLFVYTVYEREQLILILVSHIVQMSKEKNLTEKA